jgi:hypothetical protein
MVLLRALIWPRVIITGSWKDMIKKKRRMMMSQGGRLIHFGRRAEMGHVQGARTGTTRAATWAGLAWF